MPAIGGSALRRMQITPPVAHRMIADDATSVHIDEDLFFHPDDAE
jgi:hypothetical protein